MSGPIVVALDAAHPAPEAEALALAFSDATGDDLLLATVFPVIELHARVERRPYERLLREEAQGFLEGRAEELRRRGAKSVSTKAVGSISAGHALHRLAEETAAALVVLGPTHRHGTVPGPMGSRLAHDAPCPVAVAPKGYQGGSISRITVAFAPTPDGERALAAAAQLAGRAGASLEAVAVVARFPWYGLVEPEFDGVTLNTVYGRHIAAALRDAVAALPDDAPAVEQRVTPGDPVEVLADLSGRRDLIVCGSRGYGPVGFAVLGSVSRELLAQARGPVLIVPRTAGHERDAQSRSFAA